MEPNARRRGDDQMKLQVRWIGCTISRMLVIERLRVEQPEGEKRNQPGESHDAVDTACRKSVPRTRSAREVRGIIDAAGALVHRDLRIRAQRSRTIDFALRH